MYPKTLNPKKLHLKSLFLKMLHFINLTTVVNLLNPAAHSPSTQLACCNVDPEQAPTHCLFRTRMQSPLQEDQLLHGDQVPAGEEIAIKVPFVFDEI